MSTSISRRTVLRAAGVAVALPVLDSLRPRAVRASDHEPIKRFVSLLFDLQCNGQIEPMKAWLDFSSSSAEEQPPSITVDMPSSVTCGATVDLDETISDPDGDAGTVEWELDGVLLSPSVTQIEVDEHYDITATVRDARGGSGTDDHEIDCTPP